MMGRCYVRSVGAKRAGGRDKTENEEGRACHSSGKSIGSLSLLPSNAAWLMSYENESYNDNNLAHMYVV